MVALYTNLIGQILLLPFTCCHLKLQLTRFFMPIGVILIFGLNLQAQTPDFTILNTNNGLPSNNVYQVFQDKTGFIWLATEEGLFRFDGMQYLSYHKTEQSALAGSNIQQDITGRIWYQNFDGFCYYTKGDSLKQINANAPIGFLPFGITNQHVFVLQQQGVDVFDVTTLNKVKTIPLLFKNVKHSIAFNNNFIIIEENEIVAINNNLELKKLPIKLPDKTIAYNLYAANNNLYIVPKLNEFGYFLNFTSLTKTFATGQIQAKQIQGISHINNQLWVLTPSGIEIQSKDGSKKIFEKYSITNTIADNNGYVWIGTLNKGIIIVKNINTWFKDLSSIEPNLITKHNDDYVIFSKQDEVYSLNKNLNETKLLASHSGNSAPYFCYNDKALNHFFVSSKGLYVYLNGNFKQPLYFNSAVKDIVKVDEKYYAYAASGNVGLFKTHQNNNIKSEWDSLFEINAIDNFSHLIVNIRAKSIVYDKQNKCFYATSNQGLHKLTQTGNVLILQQNKPIYANKLFFYNQTLYALTTKGELFTTKNFIDWNNLNLQNNLNAARFLKVKQFDSLLFITDKYSLYLFNLNTNSFEPTALTQNINMFDASDYLLDNGYFVVLKHSGLVKYPLNFSMQQQEDPKFVINQISTNENIFLPNELTQLKYYENNININFSVLDFLTPKKHQISYSFDSIKWQTISSETRNISFASLAPGNYKLLFKLNNKVQSNNAVVFSILKPFWQTNWFIFLSVLIFVTSTFLIYKWQVNLIVKRNKLLTEKMSLENDLNKSMLVAIRSQMNPHFFYNALNTIQSYIFRNDKKSASNYLSMFSKLTRSILEMSEKDLIKLSDEIHALTLYLELEKIRFENNLQYQIEVGNDISLDVCKIPPMLIQPYVENAIKHGLLHLKENRRLHIAFNIVNKNYITVTIDDNGVGRKKSAELNKIKNRLHQSFATEANAKRLHILNNNKTFNGIEIIDKTSKEGFALGTTVILNIPYH